MAPIKHEKGIIWIGAEPESSSLENSLQQKLIWEWKSQRMSHYGPWMKTPEEYAIITGEG